MEHYYTKPMKQTFKWVVEKRTIAGMTIEKFEFDNKNEAEEFLSETNYYINGVLTHKAN